ncbi:MAG: hypothetical protein AB1705_17670 [Verrucomicrobiota bacterium]
MISKQSAFTRLALLSLALLPLLAFASAQTPKDNLNLEVRLIWGANEPQSPDPKHKALDSVLTKWLSNKLKWKYYFEVNRQTPSIPVNASKSVSLSAKCRVDVKNLGGSRIEVNLFGDGKHVRKEVQVLKDGNWLILAGDDKNDTAWFVVIKKLPPPTAEKK